MRTFKKFPKESKCPICNGNAETECILAAIDGTQEGNISEATPIHTDCIELRYLKSENLIYQKCEK